MSNQPFGGDTRYPLLSEPLHHFHHFRALEGPILHHPKNTEVVRSKLFIKVPFISFQIAHKFHQRLTLNEYRYFGMIRSIRKISSESICELCLRPLSHCEPLLPRGSPKTTERFQARPRRPSGIRAVRVPQAMFGMITLILTKTGWWFQPS